MSDLISRQAAIDAIEKALYKGTDPLTDTFIDGISDVLNGLPSAQTEPLTVNFAREMDRETVEKLKEGLKNAPVLIMAVNDSAEPERKKGKWVGVKEYCDHIAEREGKGHRFIPSGMNNCVYCNQCWESNDRRTTYCPNCGANMRGEEK